MRTFSDEEHIQIHNEIADAVYNKKAYVARRIGCILAENNINHVEFEEIVCFLESSVRSCSVNERLEFPWTESNRSFTNVEWE